MPQVLIPPPYRGPTEGAERVSVPGTTVAECIRAIDTRHPGFSTQVFDVQGNVHRFVKLFVNGDEIDRRAVDTPLADGDEVEILAAIAGG
jgi:molybdopterin converting factor small subunit